MLEQTKLSIRFQDFSKKKIQDFPGLVATLTYIIYSRTIILLVY